METGDTKVPNATSHENHKHSPLTLQNTLEKGRMSPSLRIGPQDSSAPLNFSCEPKVLETHENTLQTKEKKEYIIDEENPVFSPNTSISSIGDSIVLPENAGPYSHHKHVGNTEMSSIEIKDVSQIKNIPAGSEIRRQSTDQYTKNTTMQSPMSLNGNKFGRDSIMAMLLKMSSDSGGLLGENDGPTTLPKFRFAVHKIIENIRQQKDAEKANPSSITPGAKKSHIIRGSLNCTEEERKKKIIERVISFMKPSTSPVRKRPFSMVKFRHSARSDTETNSFENFVSLRRGQSMEVEMPLESMHPQHKINKILVLQGREFEYPALIIPCASSFRIRWTVLVAIISFYQSIFYPYELAAYPDGLQNGKFNAYYVIELILMVIFFLDVIINFRTTYMDSNWEEIVDPKMVAKHYVKKPQFIFDIISCLPVPEIALIMIGSNCYYFKLFYLIRISRLIKVRDFNKYVTNQTYLTLISFVNMWILFIVLSHWLTCGWYAIVNFQYINNKHKTGEFFWLPPFFANLVSDGVEGFYERYSNLERYGFIYYEIFIAMIGNDMLPQTQLEIYFSIVTVIGGSIFMGYMFGYIAMLIYKLSKEKDAYQSKLEELDLKLRSNKIPKDMRRQVFEYFRFCWRKHKIFNSNNDFSELSLPLQRDILFYQHKELVLKVPLFKELEPIEILSIIQKFRTVIYMPGDKILREGERANEMFFINEGVAEIVIRKNKALAKKEDPVGTPPHSVIRVTKNKGDFFGEIALIMNSRRTYDVNALEFCILEAFSKNDYENLKVEFPDVIPRLKAGIRHYKNTHHDRIMVLVKKTYLFQDFTDEELDEIVMYYFDEIFIDPKKVILKPKLEVNAFYILLLGSVRVLSNTINSKNFVKDRILKSSSCSAKIPKLESHDGIECFDDQVSTMENRDENPFDKEETWVKAKTLIFGDHFGGLDFKTTSATAKRYYISDTPCQLAMLSQNLLERLKSEKPNYYKRLKKNAINHNKMVLEESSDSDEGIQMEFPLRTSFIPKSRALEKIKECDSQGPSLRNSSLGYKKKPIFGASQASNIDKETFENLQKTVVLQNNILQSMQTQLNSLCQLNSIKTTNERRFSLNIGKLTELSLKNQGARTNSSIKKKRPELDFKDPYLSQRNSDSECSSYTSHGTIAISNKEFKGKEEEEEVKKGGKSDPEN